MDSFREKFEKRLKMFSLEVIYFCAKANKSEVVRLLSNQLLRSGTSVGANIAEARGCGTKRDYTHFFETALKSANETIYWLSLFQEADPNLSKDADKLLCEIKEIARMISSSILTMKGKR